MRRDTLIVLASLALSAVAFGGAYALQRGPLRHLRSQLQLTVTEDVLKNLPPELAFTQVALGSFRGLAVDYLWTRATRLKEEGKFYELMQLSDWITKLQPRFAKVWEFQAWNMAYNLSQATHTPEESWLWVQAGIRLLRDQGIPLNPRAVTLYQQLAYIFYHRVGKFAADAHWYFKQQHAREWHVLLGPPPEGQDEDFALWFKPVAEAPASLAGLLEKEPAAAERLAALRKLGFEPDRRLLERLAELYALRAARAPGTPLTAEQDATLAAPDAAGLLAALDGPPGQALVAFARARILKNEYHMAPAFMHQLLTAFGPLDWRHPATHAVYWALLGARRVAGSQDADFFDITQADRLVLYGLQTLAFGGKVYFEPLTGYCSFLPEPRLFDAFERAAREAARRQKIEEVVPNELREAHRGFLEWATQAAYLYGSREKAAEYYRRLRTTYGVEERNATLYTKPLDEFVMAQALGGTKQLEDARQVVAGWAFLVFSQGLANGRADVAARFFALAKQVYETYQQQKRRVAPNVGQQPLELPPLADLVADALAQFMSAPPQAAPLRIKKRVWDGVEGELKRKVYDRLAPLLKEEARRAGWDAAAAFPTPAGD